MVEKKSPAVTARRQARERLARERAEQAERNRRNEEDLIDFLTLEQQIAAADADRDTAISAAEKRHESHVKKLKQRQAGCLAKMNRRGEAVTAIAARTGLTSRAVKQLVSHAPEPESDQAPKSAPTGQRNQPVQSASQRPMGSLGDGPASTESEDATTEAETAAP